MGKTGQNKARQGRTGQDKTRQPVLSCPVLHFQGWNLSHPFSKVSPPVMLHIVQRESGLVWIDGTKVNPPYMLHIAQRESELFARLSARFAFLGNWGANDEQRARKLILLLAWVEEKAGTLARLRAAPLQMSTRLLCSISYSAKLSFYGLMRQRSARLICSISYNAKMSFALDSLLDSHSWGIGEHMTNNAPGSRFCCSLEWRKELGHWRRLFKGQPAFYTPYHTARK